MIRVVLEHGLVGGERARLVLDFFFEELGELHLQRREVRRRFVARLRDTFLEQLGEIAKCPCFLE